MRTLWFKKKGDPNTNEASLDVEDGITIDKLKELLLKEKVFYFGENVAKADIDIQTDDKSDPLPPRQKISNLTINEEDALLVSVRNASIVYIKDESKLKIEKKENVKRICTTQEKANSSHEVVDLCDSDNERSNSTTLGNNTNNNNNQTQIISPTPIGITEYHVLPLDLNEDPDEQPENEDFSFQLLRKIVPPDVPESQLRTLLNAMNKDINAVIHAINKGTEDHSSSSSSSDSDSDSSGSSSGSSSSDDDVQDDAAIPPLTEPMEASSAPVEPPVSDIKAEPIVISMEPSAPEQPAPVPTDMSDVYTHEEEPSSRHRTQIQEDEQDMPASPAPLPVPVKTEPKGQESIGQQARILRDQRVGTIYRYQPFEKKYWLLVDTQLDESNESEEESEEGRPSLVCADAEEIEVIPEPATNNNNNNVSTIQSDDEEPQQPQEQSRQEEPTQMLADSEVEILENADIVEGYRFIGNFPRGVLTSNLKHHGDRRKRINKGSKIVFDLSEGVIQVNTPGSDKPVERKTRKIIATMKGIDVIKYTPQRPKNHYHIVGRLTGHSVDYLFPLMKENIIKIKGYVPKQQTVYNGEYLEVVLKVYLKDQPEPALDQVSKYRLAIQKFLDKMDRVHTPGSIDSEAEDIINQKKKQKEKKYSKITKDMEDFIVNDLPADQAEEDEEDEPQNGEQDNDEDQQDETPTSKKKKRSSPKQGASKSKAVKSRKEKAQEQSDEENEDNEEANEDAENTAQENNANNGNNENEQGEDDEEEQDDQERVVDLVAQEEHRQMFVAELATGIYRGSVRQLQRMESEEDSEYYDNLVRQFVALSTPLVSQPLAVDARTADSEGKDSVAKFVDKNIEEKDIDQLYSVTNSDEIDTTPNPVGLNVTLWSYQQQALTWMKHREVAHVGLRPIDIKYTMYHFKEPEESNKEQQEFPSKVYFDVKSGHVTTTAPLAKPLPLGGLLADEMGMGKTVEMVSLVLDTIRKCDARPDGMGGTLIVVPSSVLDQWYNELTKLVAKDFLSVYLYQGAGRSKKSKKLAKYDIVLTNYPTLATEYRQQEVGVKKRRRDQYEAEVSEDERADRTPQVKKTPSPLLKMPWFRVVLDEAHTINTLKSDTFASCHMLQTERHWALSGTPIQNKVDDLFSFFKFLRVPIFGEQSTWNKIISMPFQNQDKRALIRIHDLLHPLMLRRSKSQEINGSRLLSLPPKTIEVVRLKFSQDEQDVYDSLFRESSTKFNTYIEKGTVLANYQRVVALLLRLRQACNHPYIAINSIARSLEKRRLKEQKERQAQEAYFESIQGTSPQDDKINLKAPLIKPDPDAEIDTILHHSVAQAIHEPTLTEKDIYTQYVSSAKIDALFERLDRIEKQDEENGEFTKCVAFSQWTEMLDIVEYALKQKNVKYQRLDGKVSVANGKRDKILNHFKQKANCRILLISIKTGGLGLQLSAANVVFLLDPWWNPAVEMQAIDRVHRIGQTKPVFVYKFIMKNTVEEPLLKLQEGKKALLQGLQKTRQETKDYKLEELKQLFDRPEFKLSKRNLEQESEEKNSDASDNEEQDDDDADDSEDSDDSDLPSNTAVVSTPSKRKANSNSVRKAKNFVRKANSNSVRKVKRARTQPQEDDDQLPELVDSSGEDEPIIQDEPINETEMEVEDEDVEEPEEEEEEEATITNVVEEDEEPEEEEPEEDWDPESKKETDLQRCLEKAIKNILKKGGQVSVESLWDDIEEELVELGNKKDYAFTWAFCGKIVPHKLFTKWLKGVIDHPLKAKFINFMEQQLYPDEVHQETQKKATAQQSPSAKSNNNNNKSPISARRSR